MLNINCSVSYWYLTLYYVCVCSVLLGVIRSIDPVEKCFFILTPLCQSDLSKVNCLLKGSLDVPRQILMAQVSTGRYLLFLESIGSEQVYAVITVRVCQWIQNTH